jgi:carboxyl-terminal processing protease
MTGENPIRGGSRWTRLVAGASLLLLWPGAAPARAQSDCSVLGETTFVRDTLQEFYLWYRELPDLDPALYDSPEAYLEAVRYRPLDTTFSYVADRAASDSFYSDSQFIGIGFSAAQTGPAQIRIAQVFPDSPASEAGLARGDELLTIGGRAVADLLASGEYDAAFGPSQIGVSVELGWRARDGAERRAVVTKRPVTIPTVSLTSVIDVGGRRVGYVNFRNFVQPSFVALDAAFRELQTRGVDDLVLDLRYNGGGLISVAVHLGGLIGGVRTVAQVFTEFFHNDKNAFRNQVLRFEDPPAALDLPRLIVITTRGSASASESVINGLRPFIPVTIVGEATYGKPVGQYGFDFCDKVLFPVAFQLRNAAGQGDYFGGFPADCAAGDDLDHPLGDPGEASLAEALSYARTGTCSAAAAGAARAQSRLRSAIRYRPRPDPWRQLVNAY